MKTLRGTLEQTIKEARQSERIYAWVEENYPELLELTATRIYSYHYGSIDFMISADDYEDGGNGLAAKVASILDVEESKRKMIRNGCEITRFNVPAEQFKYSVMSIETRVHRKNGCKNYRVVREYETKICGEIDESEYLSVEEIEG